MAQLIKKKPLIQMKHQGDVWICGCIYLKAVKKIVLSDYN